MSGLSFSFSPTVWVDPLVFVCLLVAAYNPLKDLYVRRSRKAKHETERTRDREDKLDQLLQDWHGTPERPGFPEIPGIPTRIYLIEHEIKHNGGGSIKDAVHRTDEAVAGLRQDLSETRHDVKSLQDRFGAN